MPSCYDEFFTYRLAVELPPAWDLVTPGISSDGDPARRCRERLEPIEDIFLCAAPRFDRLEACAGGHRLRVYAAGLERPVAEALMADFKRSVEVMHGHFGPMPPGRGGVAVVSPRSPQGAEWGFERGDLWVVGDSFVNEVARSDWWPSYLPGPMSPSLHETIHSWLGLGLRFTEPWLCEGLTQYLQVVLSEELFGRPGLAGDYFASYVPRIEAALARDDRAIARLVLADNPYDHWYLKGSWAFWDLEAAVGREPLLDGLAAFYRRYLPGPVGSGAFIHELGEHLGTPTGDHFRHWFEGQGFRPRHR